MIYSATFSRDGRRVISASKDTTVCVWDCDPRSVHHLEKLQHMEHYEKVFRASISNDGTRAITTSSDACARLWFLDSPNREPQLLKCQYRNARACDVSSNASHAVATFYFGKRQIHRYNEHPTSSFRSMVKIVDAVTGDDIYDVILNGIADRVRISRSGKTLAVGLYAVDPAPKMAKGDNIIIFDAAGRELNGFKNCFPEEDGCNSWDLSDNGTALAICADGRRTVEVYHSGYKNEWNSEPVELKAGSDLYYENCRLNENGDIAAAIATTSAGERSIFAFCVRSNNVMHKIPYGPSPRMFLDLESSIYKEGSSYDRVPRIRTLAKNDARSNVFCMATFTLAQKAQPIPEPRDRESTFRRDPYGTTSPIQSPRLLAQPLHHNEAKQRPRDPRPRSRKQNASLTPPLSAPQSSERNVGHNARQESHPSNIALSPSLAAPVIANRGATNSPIQNPVVTPQLRPGRVAIPALRSALPKGQSQEQVSSSAPPVPPQQTNSKPPTDSVNPTRVPDTMPPILPSSMKSSSPAPPPVALNKDVNAGVITRVCQDVRGSRAKAREGQEEGEPIDISGNPVNDPSDECDSGAYASDSMLTLTCKEKEGQYQIFLSTSDAASSDCSGDIPVVGDGSNGSPGVESPSSDNHAANGASQDGAALECGNVAPENRRLESACATDTNSRTASTPVETGTPRAHPPCRGAVTAPVGSCEKTGEKTATEKNRATSHSLSETPNRYLVPRQSGILSNPEASMRQSDSHRQVNGQSHRGGNACALGKSNARKEIRAGDKSTENLHVPVAGGTVHMKPEVKHESSAMRNVAQLQPHPVLPASIKPGALPQTLVKCQVKYETKTLTESSPLEPLQRARSSFKKACTNVGETPKTAITNQKAFTTMLELLGSENALIDNRRVAKMVYDKVGFNNACTEAMFLEAFFELYNEMLTMRRRQLVGVFNSATSEDGESLLVYHARDLLKKECSSLGARLASNLSDDIIVETFATEARGVLLDQNAFVRGTEKILNYTNAMA